MSKPNVIVFFTDQQRWDTTGVHGNPMGLTPNFDRFARSGTHFFNTITCQPVCAPARSSLQTGRYATNTGVWRNGLGLNPDEPTLARYFSQEGYTTGYIGKWHLYGGTESHASPYGIETNDPVPRGHQGGYEYWRGSNILEFASDAYDFHLYDEEGRNHRYPGFRVDAQTDLAVRYINEHRDEPFFLILSFLEPHHQNYTDSYAAPKGYAERCLDCWIPPDLKALGGASARQLPGYYGLIKKLDEALGRIDDALISLDLEENTIVFFISDHGCHFNTRIGYDKRSGHESSVRIPCMAKGPHFNEGGQIRRLFSLVDAAPTLLDAAGIPVPSEMDGSSILPVIQKTEIEWQDDVFIQISESCTGRALRTKRWKYIVHEEGSHGMSDKPGADIYRESELYDLENDPYELRSLAGLDAYRDISDRLKHRLLKRILSVEGKTPEIVNAEKRLGGQSMLPANQIDI